MPQTILIAEDDSELSDVLSQLLESSGYAVIKAQEGVEVFEMATQNKPDLILLDWNMPFGKGSAVLEMLSEKKVIPLVPVIVLSGADEPGLKELALSLGAVSVIRKPYDNKRLIEEISRVLKK